MSDRIEFCDKDCEFKKILKDPHRYSDFMTFALTQCSLCIHSEKQDLFTPREEVVESTSTWGKLVKVFKEHCIRGSG